MLNVVWFKWAFTQIWDVSDVLRLKWYRSGESGSGLYFDGFKGRRVYWVVDFRRRRPAVR